MFVVSTFNKFMTNLGFYSYKLLNISWVKYVKGTWDYKILFKKGDFDELKRLTNLDLVGDEEERWSITNYMFQLGGRPIT
jgi:CRISPR/Cas system-associated protein Cas10 (large subunit of type III CRISPR-Cas system)